MAITRETLRLVEQMRRGVDDLADGVVRDLTAAWVRAWDTIAPDVVTALDDIVQLIQDGRWPTRDQVLRSGRVISALELVRRALEQISTQAGIATAAAAGTAAQTTAAAQAAVIGSQLPQTAAGVAAVTFGTVPAEQLNAIVRRSTQQIHARHRPLAPDAVEGMKRSLIRGVAVGENPRATAREMLRRCEGEFNGGLARAANIARTEILDSHRAAAQVSQDAAANVLDVWVWNARLEPERTCIACWVMHGTEHPLAEPGPLDHQSGRCSRTPKTKSWADLGFDLDEPESLLPDAEATFSKLPRAVKLQILGAKRLQLLEDGDITWTDLAKRRTTSGWRDSYVPATLKDLAGS